MIELSGINKSFHTAVVLRNIDLTIKEREIFGIIGKSGAGKSTLLRCINLLEKPDQGRVLIDGENITGYKNTRLRKARHKMAMIFQQFNLLNSQTVYENIALPMRIQGIDPVSIHHKIQELLPLVELSDKAHAYPSQLSGGQKQRVAIARALSCSPKILLCDEATSSLDPETTEAVLALLKKINARYGITIVLITHEMDVVRQICHRIAVMDAGQIVETTALTDVFGRKNSLARNMLYTQLSPKLPASLLHRMTDVPNDTPLLRLFFEGHEATAPFISQASRALNLDINILLANIDRLDEASCGVLFIEIKANADRLQAFLQHCEQSKLTVEILGYVTPTAA